MSCQSHRSGLNRCGHGFLCLSPQEKARRVPITISGDSAGKRCELGDFHAGNGGLVSARCMLRCQHVVAKSTICRITITRWSVRNPSGQPDKKKSQAFIRAEQRSELLCMLSGRKLRSRSAESPGECPTTNPGTAVTATGFAGKPTPPATNSRCRTSGGTPRIPQP